MWCVVDRGRPVLLLITLLLLLLLLLLPQIMANTSGTVCSDVLYHLYTPLFSSLSRPLRPCAVNLSTRHWR